MLAAFAVLFGIVAYFVAVLSGSTLLFYLGGPVFWFGVIVLLVRGISALRTTPHSG